MTSHPAPPPRTTARALLVALASLAVAAAAAFVLLDTARQSWAAIGAPGPASPADGVLLVIGTAGAFVAVWFGLGLALSALAGLPGAAGRVAHRASERLAPAAVRRVAAFLIGTTLTAALVPGTAVASGTLVAPSRAAGAAAAHALQVAPDPAFAAGHSATPSAPDPSFAAAPPTTSTAGDASAPAAPDPSWTPNRPAPARRAMPSVDLLSSRPVAGRTVDEHVVVRRGDTLWDIAARHLGPSTSAEEVAREWPRWYAANRHVIGDDPDLLKPGQLLTPPDSPASPS